MITCEVVTAYAQCKFKAYTLLTSGGNKIPHEYISILEEETKKNKENYLSNVRINNQDAKLYSTEAMKDGISTLLDANFRLGDLEAYADVLTLVEQNPPQNSGIYIPTLAIGTHKISKSQKLMLGFSGYVLSKLQNKKVVRGTIIGKGAATHSIKLEHLYKEIDLSLKIIKKWIDSPPSKPPSIILNNHCPLCPFSKACEAKCVESDHLSLLNSISTEKQIIRFERKGIFKVNQLSYLYRPRRQRKRSRKPPSMHHSIELQALVLRIGKTYVHSPPELVREKVELFLDFEGIPDNDNFYLIGLLVCRENYSNHYSYWANTTSDELQIWQQLVCKLEEYPNCPIFHYGTYETKAITELGQRYGTETKGIVNRLKNVNAFIYGKIYFPLRSNRLKEIGRFIGASWSSADASGLQSLVWRHHWENSQNLQYKQKLVTYNYEDCQALKLLVDLLSVIREKDDSVLDIDRFVHSKKSRDSKEKIPIHQQLETILKFAHADYDQSKISFSAIKKEDKAKQKPIFTKPLAKYRRVTQIVHVPRVTKCPRCENTSLQDTKRKQDEKIQIDLVFSKNGIRKSVIKYVSPYVRCKSCKSTFKSIEFSGNGRPALYGLGFKVWVVYQRVSMRLPYRSISRMIEDTFNEKMNLSAVMCSLGDVAPAYAVAEEQIIKKLLVSPFLHVDETQVNIDHFNQYIWVITDGKHVVYKFTKTREASFIHDFLSTYKGVLIADFYPGFDSLQCMHQKCLVHIIRDLNNDLWSNPFDDELTKFVHEVKNLFFQIMEGVQKYGLKQRNLSQFYKAVAIFYGNTIDDHSYQSSLCSKYQERFIKYRESLFTFLGQDGIPWHNNPAENALRAIILQLDISRILHESVIADYLTLLSIKQTCKVQKKSFLRFLLSGQQDVDFFKDTKLRKPLRGGRGYRPAPE